MPTAWTPFPTFSLVFAPLVGAALNTLKSRYIAGTDYYQEASHEPPYMSDELIADFQKVYDECIQKLAELYTKEFGTQCDTADHFQKEYYPAGTPAIILKVLAASRQMFQLVEFERWIHAMVLGNQQRREMEIQRSKDAWAKLQEQYKNTPWPVPGNRDIIMFMATRIQTLEEQISKLLGDR